MIYLECFLIINLLCLYEVHYYEPYPYNCILISKIILFQKEYLCLHTGGYNNSYAIRKALDLCFNKEMLNQFSYHGRSKNFFKSLKIFNVIKGIKFKLSYYYI